jgi:hypothetical protein
MRSLLLIISLFISALLGAQNMEGAWKLTHEDGKEVNDRVVIKIYQDGYFAFISKEAETNKFLEAGGGEFFLDNGYSEVYDFHTGDSTLVGQEVTFTGYHRYDGLVLQEIAGGPEKTWKRISTDKNDLSGNWVITGRQRNGELQRSTPGARRTIKILAGDRFQWAAFNSDTGEFYGSGGGIYSAEDGKYTENIEFFSRDNGRVGAELQFDYKIEDREWYHSGKSSKGEPLFEIWTPYRQFYKREE